MGLRAWKSYQALCKEGHHPRRMGFRCDRGDLNRFEARVRLAHSFEGVRLRGYKEETEQGYGSLIRAALAYSAVESLRGALGYKADHEFGPDLGGHDSAEVVRRFREADIEDRFGHFVRDRVNDRLKRRLEALYADGPGPDASMVHLGAGLRHIFVHGHLTPSARKVPPRRAAQACDVVTHALLGFVDDAFASRVESYASGLGCQSHAGPASARPRHA
ncbi:hypothetical protein [Rubrivirga sp. IMCC45206]|uniref:hypothetical protein n=1 Tax=Rubrivirga sp. IMCC45206 TaxID=3391614 RepID=UPI00399015E1